MNLKELTETAIVGTGQKEINLSFAGSPMQKILSRLDWADKEGSLLRAAFLISNLNRTGQVFEYDKEELPPKAEPETLTPLSKKQRSIFDEVNSERLNLRTELLQLMDKHRKQIPHNLIDRMFVSAAASLIKDLENDTLFQEILPVIGNRGRWLAKYTDPREWIFVEENYEEIWDTGNIFDRHFTLRWLRNKNPDEGRRILEKTWKSESAEDRAIYLRLLKINLSLADEPFLLDIWENDRSSEVRTVAFNLLGVFPCQKLVDEYSSLVESTVSIKKGSPGLLEFEVSFPADWGKKTKKLREFAEFFFGSNSYFGKKGMSFVVGLSLVNPQIWQEKFGLNAKEFLKAANFNHINKNEYRRTFLAGIGMASIRFCNQEWFTAFAPWRGDGLMEMDPMHLWELYRYLPFSLERMFELSKMESMFEAYTFSSFEFNESPQAINFFRDKIEQILYFRQGYPGSNFVEIGSQIPAELIDFWLEHLGKIHYGNSDFDRGRQMVLDKLIEDLKFRKEMHEAFENEVNN